MNVSSENLYQYEEEFRDTIATVDEHGKRIWIYPKKPSGRLHSWRIFVTTVLLSILFIVPFITVKGRPLMLFNIFERKFIVFGQIFWPQDFFLFALTLITFFVLIILFTVVFGRIWCGWACPQTLFTEMVFRKIEYWIEGSANEQRKLNNGPLTASKVYKKTLKHTIFILISIIISHTLMSYLIGVESVMEIVTHSPTENPAGFTGIVVFTTVFYLVFSKFREQACIAVCPYGRLQSVLLGVNSIVVAYDFLRGEPRGKVKKNQVSAGNGDCIDCKLCVHVCPTGIDIRNGTQLECVNCTACIDACDEVMVKVNKPLGLIRYASFDSIKTGTQKLLKPSVIGYCIVLFFLMGILSFAILSRKEVETTILKIPGTLYQETEDGYITNLYNIEFVNKTFEVANLEVVIEAPPHAVLSGMDGTNDFVVKPEDLLKGICFVKIPRAEITAHSTEVVLGIYKDKTKIDKKSVRFVGPIILK